MRQIIRAGFLFCILAFLKYTQPLEGSSRLCPLAWEDYTQPIGTLVRLWDVSGPLPLPIQPPSRIPPFTTPTTPVQEVNYICAQWDTNVIPLTSPFDTSIAVTEVIPTQPLHFVRIYSRLRRQSKWTLDYAFRPGSRADP